MTQMPQMKRGGQWRVRPTPPRVAEVRHADAVRRIHRYRLAQSIIRIRPDTSTRRGDRAQLVPVGVGESLFLQLEQINQYSY